QCLDAAVVLVAAPIKDDLCDAFVQRPPPDDATDELAGVDVLGALPLELRPNLGIERRCGDEGMTGRVVDDLGIDVLQAAKDHQTRALRRPGEPLSKAGVPDPALLDGVLAHHFLPFPPLAPALALLPALRRMTSPWYRIPFPLYGSGFR